MKQVLIITYYWPPSGGAGVQRWLKFVKYLRQYNWEPVVYTPSNPEMPYVDNSLLADIPKDVRIINQPIIEPYQLYRRFTGKKKGEKFQHGFLKDQQNKPEGLKEKIAVWIRGNLFIPDARVFWVKPSVRYLTTYLKDNPVDIVVTTGPPHSVHLIGKAIKKKMKLPWIADFRDPWTGIYYFDKLMLTKFAKMIHQRMEKKVLNQADQIVVVGDTMKKDFEKMTGASVTTITNGFDHEDYNKITGTQKPDKFRIVYTGMFLPDQNPAELWEVLSELVQENKKFAELFEILFVGKTDSTILDSIRANDLMEFLSIEDYIPHEELSAKQQIAAVLLLSINRIPNASYILTGKVFEYLSSGRPILAICPEESDIASIIIETNSGLVVPFNQKFKLKQSLIILFDAFLKDSQLFEPHNIEAYSRLALTKRMAMLFDEVISTK